MHLWIKKISTRFVKSVTALRLLSVSKTVVLCRQRISDTGSKVQRRAQSSNWIEVEKETVIVRK